MTPTPSPSGGHFLIEVFTQAYINKQFSNLSY
jgi:hypothetical protein